MLCVISWSPPLTSMTGGNQSSERKNKAGVHKHRPTRAKKRKFTAGHGPKTNTYCIVMM